jgi:hypothetical protein
MVVWAWVICAPVPAFAQAPPDKPERPWLEWVLGVGAQSCSDAAAFVATVEEQLRASPARAAAQTRVSISIRVGRESALSGRWWAELQVRGANDQLLGGRSLRRGGDSCRQLEEVLAFMTTLVLSGASPERVLDPPATPPPAPASRAEAGGQPSSPLPSPVLPPAPKPEAPPAAISQPPYALPPPGSPVTVIATRATPPALARSAGWFAVDAGLATSIGQLPRAGFGITALASVRPKLGGPRVTLSFGFWPEQRASIDGGRGVTTTLVVGGLGGCPLEARWTSRSASACFVAEVARMEASGWGFPIEQRQSRWVADLGAGGELRQHLAGGLFGVVEARALVPVLRARIGFVGADGQTQNVFTTWPVSAVAALRLGYQF